MQTYLLHKVFSLKRYSLGSQVYNQILALSIFAQTGLKKMETNQIFHLGRVVGLGLDLIWVVSAKIDRLSMCL